MSYLYLLLAIVGELLGTNLLKLSAGFTKPIQSISALLSYGICFFFLSLSLKKIPLGVAYATWRSLCHLVSRWISFYSYYFCYDFQRKNQCLYCYRLDFDYYRRFNG